MDDADLGRGHRFQRSVPASRIDEGHVGRRSVVAFAGELDMETAPELARAMGRAVERGAEEIWVDLAACGFMCSAGVHCLLDSETRLRALNRRLVVLCATGPVARVLELTGAATVLELHDDRAAAHRAA